VGKLPHTIKYFVTGHTAKGYVDYLTTNLVNLKHIIILQNGQPHIITQLLKKVMTTYKDAYNLEIIYNSQGWDDFGGVIFREKGVAILSEAIVRKPIKGAIYLSLNAPGKQDVQHKEVYEAAYDAFKKGLEIHDRLEKVYIREMNFDKADLIAEEFIQGLLAGKEKRHRQVHVYERLFGTNTPGGMVNFVDDLIEPIANVVYVKGRAGTGKSHFMKRVWHACMEYGYDLEIYYCSFDPKSIDMVVVRELDFCMFDSTPPHEFFPKKGSDQVVDLYESTVTPGTDEKYAIEIERINKAYKAKMREGLEILGNLRERVPGKNPDLTAVLTKINQLMVDK
jgi:hypothetical protein